MSSLSEFYLTLSGLSDNLEYRFTLPNEINLYSDWEVGVKQVDFSGDFVLHSSEEDRTITFKKKEDEDWEQIVIPPVCVDNLRIYADIISLVMAKQTNEKHLFWLSK